MVTPVQQSAVNDINAKLDSSGWFNPVTHAEMNDVKARLAGLSAGDADAVIDELAKNGKLDTFAREAVDGSWFGNGGYTDGERTSLFNDLSGKLDGTSLKTLSDSFARTDGGEDGYGRVTALADSIASHSSANQKVDFIKASTADTTDGKGINSAGLGGSSIREVDPQATAVATVLGSLKGAQAEAGFRALDPVQTRAVMRSGLDATIHTSGGPGGPASTLSWHTGKLTDILAAAATVPDADLKARLFDAGVDTMRSVRDAYGVIGGLTVLGKDAAMTSIRDGLTKIVDSDVSGVVSELNRNNETKRGADFSAYAKEMLAGGQENKLGEQMAKLQFGNNLNENAIDRLYDKTPVPGTPADGRYRNTEALGYFIGAVNKGATAVGKDVTAEQQMTTNVLKSALTLIDKVGGKAGGGAVGIAASVAKEWVQSGVQSAITNSTGAIADRLEGAALPLNTTTGESAVGTAIDEAFGAAVERVIRATEI